MHRIMIWTDGRGGIRKGGIGGDMLAQHGIRVSVELEVAGHRIGEGC